MATLNYSIFAVSVLSYLCQFSLPGQGILGIERRATQYLTAGPCNASCTNAVQYRCNVGFTIELLGTRLELACTAVYRHGQWIPKRLPWGSDTLGFVVLVCRNYAWGDLRVILVPSVGRHGGPGEGDRAVSPTTRWQVTR